MNRSVLISTFLLLFLIPLSVSAQDWEWVGKIDGVKVWKKQIEGSNLLAFRGELTAETTIGQIMSVFTNPKRRKDWVAKHRDSRNLEAGPGFQEYWISFNTPFPVSDRDYVLRSDGILDPDNRTFTCNIKSVKRKDAPEDDCCVRAQLNGTYYRFTAIKGEEKVKMVVEVHTDPKGMLPGWLVNMIQKKWPSDTLNGLVREANKTSIPHADYVDWHS